jgi:hypothetical protein
LSAKVVPIFVVGECHVVNATELYGRNLGFLELRSNGYFTIKRGRARVDPELKLEYLDVTVLRRGVGEVRAVAGTATSC